MSSNSSSGWGAWDFSNILETAQTLAEQAKKEAITLYSNVEEEIQTQYNQYTLEANKKAALERQKKINVIDLQYITENIISMSFPYDPSNKKNPSPQSEGESAGLHKNDINVVSKYLNRKHADRYMVWNISESKYDISLFNNNVLEYSFPGHPSPPLSVLFKMCMSIESWLDADERNVCVVHCMTGKGRTCSLIACVLTWMNSFRSINEALQYVSDRRGVPVDRLLIPSQRRYLQFFDNVLEGVKPRSEPLLLRRVVMGCVPDFTSEEKLRAEEGGEQTGGCSPYIQLFKCGKLIATASSECEHKKGDLGNINFFFFEMTCTDSVDRNVLKWVSVSEGSCAFSLDCALQGDILLRIRHASASGHRVSMLRAAFHTGFLQLGVTRFHKNQLDGACDDDRFPDDFFLDLIFAPIETTSISKSINPSSNIPAASSNSSAPIVASGVASDSGLVVESSSLAKYEESINKDVRFWEAIAARKLKTNKKKSRLFETTANNQFSIGEDSLHYFDNEEEEREGVKVKEEKKKEKNYTQELSEDQSLINLAQLSDEELILQLSLDLEKKEKKDEKQGEEMNMLDKFENELGLRGNRMQEKDSTLEEKQEKEEKEVADEEEQNGENGEDENDELAELEEFLKSLSTSK